jgi:hypothetical protein
MKLYRAQQIFIIHTISQIYTLSTTIKMVKCYYTRSYFQFLLQRNEGREGRCATLVTSGLGDAGGRGCQCVGCGADRGTAAVLSSSMSLAGAEICRWETSRFSADKRSPHPAWRLLRGGSAVDGGQSGLTRGLLNARSMGAILSSPASTGGRWEEGRSAQDLEEGWLGWGKGRGGECSARDKRDQLFRAGSPRLRLTRGMAQRAFLYEMGTGQRAYIYISSIHLKVG